MTPEQKQLIKEKMSKILVKWSMPTRQVAINEIVQEFDLAIKQTEEKIGEKMHEYYIGSERADDFPDGYKYIYELPTEAIYINTYIRNK